MKDPFWRSLLYLIVIFLLAVGVFIFGNEFYLTLAIVIIIFLIVLFAMRKYLKQKVFTIILVSFFVICALTVAGYEINKSYYNNLPTVNEQGVNLNEYKPYQENTKAMRLEDPTTLRIKSDLPKLDGATALYPLYSAFAQATYPEKDYDIHNSEVMCNNTIGAYENLINGKVDIIFAARPSEQQIEKAKSKGIELKLTPIGREAFVFFVNSKNKVDELSTKQIQDIYSGNITNWKELGGKNEKIRAFQRPENSGSQTMLQKMMEGKNLMIPPKEDVVAGMGGIIEKTASYRNYKNAIGYSFLFFATEMVQNNQIRLLKVDGVYPDRNTVKSKEYPLVSDFYAVTDGSKNPNIESFIEWILTSQGQYLVEKTGYTPLK